MTQHRDDRPPTSDLDDAAIHAMAQRVLATALTGERRSNLAAAAARQRHRYVQLAAVAITIISIGGLWTVTAMRDRNEPQPPLQAPIPTAPAPCPTGTGAETTSNSESRQDTSAGAAGQPSSNLAEATLGAEHDPTTLPTTTAAAAGADNEPIPPESGSQPPADDQSTPSLENLPGSGPESTEIDTPTDPADNTERPLTGDTAHATNCP